MSKLLYRKYYEYDNAFYSKKANVDCFEQMKYQSIRDYNVDFLLLFCDDINIALKKSANGKYIIMPNSLKYNDKIFDYIKVTSDPLKAEKSIEEILEQNKVVIFRTAMDYLHTCVWFHESEPYTRFFHRAILVGYDIDNFFYVDSPPMRNSAFFKSHPENSAVGIISKLELLESFQYFCNIGYIDINEIELEQAADIKQIICGIHDSFYNDDDCIKIGRSALRQLSELLKQDHTCKEIFEDSFPYHLIASRHKKLKLNIMKYRDTLENKYVSTSTSILNQLTMKWKNIETMAMKCVYVEDINSRALRNKAAQIIQDEIYPLTEQFVNLHGE